MKKYENVELQIEYIEIDKLLPYENNARQHGEEDVAAIKKSIGDYGMCDPIGIWSDKNIIVEGHGRLLALKELGYTKAPCIRLDHMTDEERREYAIAHNKTAELSKWDFTRLEQEFGKLPAFDPAAYKFDESLLNTEYADIDLPREERGAAQNVPSIKFGSKTIYLTEEEAETFEAFYNNYVKENGTAYGLVTELLENGASRYAN